MGQSPDKDPLGLQMQNSAPSPPREEVARSRPLVRLRLSATTTALAGSERYMGRGKKVEEDELGHTRGQHEGHTIL